MRCDQLRKLMIVVLGGLASAMIVGCGSSANGLASEVTIELPDGTTTQVTAGAGVITLADTSWEFFATSGSTQGAPFVTINFGSEGELQAFENNTFASEIFGASIIFDGQQHPTAQDGLTYAAATYGAETSDATGFTFVGELNAFAVIIGKVADATAMATGTFDADDPDVMTGTFSFEYDITVEFPGVPTGGDSSEFSFIANRIVE